MSALDFRSREWPPAPLDAADMFHRDILPQLRGAARADSTVLVLPPVDHTHTAWRLAAVQEVAREAAPGRVNAVVGLTDDAVAEAVKYLRDAPGVTGQVLTVDAIADDNA